MGEGPAKLVRQKRTTEENLGLPADDTAVAAVAAALVADVAGAGVAAGRFVAVEKRRGSVAVPEETRKGPFRGMCRTS